MNTSATRSLSFTTFPRVVVTGIGLVTPFATSRDASWNAIRNGDRAVRWLNGDEFPEPIPTSVRFAGAPHAKGQILGHINPLAVSNSEPVIHLANTAAQEAIVDSGLSSQTLTEIAERCGCVIGTSKVGLRGFASAFRSMNSAMDDNGMIDLPWNQLGPDAAVRSVASTYDLRGPSLCPVAACATGLVSLIRGADLIRSGECDIVLAGSTDASLVPIVLGSFQRLGVMARGFSDPKTACRPFAADRNGFVIGEGAAVFVLEQLESAQARGASIYAEFISGGMANDPSGITQMEPDGASLAWLIGDVLRRADIAPHDIDYINLHGTATRVNDVAETQAVRTAFGAHADRVLCSSVKGAIGHLLGAAGSVETAITLLALRDQIAPPTVNLGTADPQCDLDCVANVARPARLRTVMKMSLGFGGHLAVGIFRSL